MKKVLLWFFAFISVLCLGCSLAKVNAAAAKPTVKTSETATVTDLDPVSIKFEAEYTGTFDKGALYGFAIKVGDYTLDEMKQFVKKDNALVTYAYYVYADKYETVVKNIGQSNYDKTITVLALVNEDSYITFADNVLNQKIADLLRPEEDCLHTVLTQEGEAEFVSYDKVNITFYAEHLGNDEEVLDYGFAIKVGTAPYSLAEMKTLVGTDAANVLWTNNVTNKQFKVKVNNITKANFDKYITVVAMAKTATGNVYAINAYSIKVMDFIIEQGYQAIAIDGGKATLATADTNAKIVFNAEYTGNFEEGTQFGFALTTGHYTLAEMKEMVEDGDVLVAYTTDVKDQKYKAIISNVLKKHYNKEFTVLALANENGNFVYGYEVKNVKVLDLLVAEGFVTPDLDTEEGAVNGTKEEFTLEYTATYADTLELSANAKYGFVVCVGKYTKAELIAKAEAGTASKFYTDQLTGTTYKAIIHNVEKIDYNKYISIIALIEDEGYVTYAENAQCDRIKDLLIASHLIGEVKTIDGASISLVAPVGLKFQAEITTAFDGTCSYGFAIAIGDFTTAQMIAKVENGDIAVYENESGLGKDNKYAYTVTNIPEAYYGKKITAIPVVTDEDGEYNYGTAVTRSIAEVATATMNADNTWYATDNLVKTICEAANNIKVEYADGSVFYCNNNEEITDNQYLSSGDVVTYLKDFTVEDGEELTISNDEIVLKGEFAGKYTTNGAYIAVENATDKVCKFYSKSEFESITFVKGDKVILPDGLYYSDITISVDDVTINGNNAGKLGSSNSRNDESILKNAIKVAANVKNFTINGVKFEGTEAIKLIDGGQENITVKYCILSYTGMFGIGDYFVDADANNCTHKNIVIIKNLFAKALTGSVNDICFEAYVDGLDVSENKFTNTTLTAIDKYSYTIKAKLLTAGSIVNIYKNTFTEKYVSYIVDLGEGHTAGTNNAKITIEDNAGIGSATGNEFAGNGFRVINLGNDAEVHFLHNERMRFSRYYNTVLFSICDATGSAGLGTNDFNPTIDFRFNKLYGDKDDKIGNVPSRTTSLSSNYINIGIGVKATATKVTFNYNYFSGSARGYSFTKLTSASSSKNVYGAGAITQTNVASTYDVADTQYDLYVASKAN